MELLPLSQTDSVCDVVTYGGAATAFTPIRSCCAAEDVHREMRADAGFVIRLRLQVCAVRNLYVEKGFNPTHFLSHAAFDCGVLEH